METDQVAEERMMMRLRKKGLKPIETKRASGSKLGERRERDDDGKEKTEEKEEEPLSPAARLFHEPNFNVHVIAIMGCKTPISPHVIISNLPHTLLQHPRFSSLLVVDQERKGKMKWVRTKVDIEKHVIIPNTKNPNMDPNKFVEDYVYNLSKTSLDKTRPLWDLHLLNNVKTSEAEAIAIFRIHHSLGDGTSLMSLLLACTRKMADPSAVPTIIPVRKREKKGENRNIGGFWWVFWWGLKMFWNTFVDVMMFLVTGLFLKDSETPLKGGVGSEFASRRFVYRTVCFDDMKLIKNALLDLTINDVALGITQAGLSRYLNRRYGEMKKVEGDDKKNNIPENIRLRSTLLINLRPSAGIQDLADMMEKNTEVKWGNWIGYVLLPFTIGLRDDPLDYIRQAKATIDRKKHSLEAIFTFSISELVLKFFGIKPGSALSHRVITHTTMCFSNLVGPPEEIGFYGHPMTFLAPSSYGQPHALMINFQSYVNKMTIVLSVDETNIPNPHQLLDDIVDSLYLIKAAVLERGLPLFKE